MSIGETLLRSRYRPLRRVLSYNVFSTSFNGRMTLTPNFTEYPDFDIPEALVNKDQWPPVMLSSAAFRYPDAHGVMSGTYSLKLSTRPVAVPYMEIPVEGCLGHAVKQLSPFRPGCKYLQMEYWFTYTAKQGVVSDGDRLQPGLHESSIRDFGMGFNVQEDERRYRVGIRYPSAIDGKLMQKWRYEHPNEDITDHDWAYGLDGDWCKRGVDPWWFGRRYSNGDHDGFEDLKDSHQKLIYNEADCKLNWRYMRLELDIELREYVEFQCQDKIWDMRGIAADTVDGYGRTDNLINPLFWVSTDTNRRIFFYVDSIVVSQE